MVGLVTEIQRGPEDACESVHQVTLDTQGGLRVSSLESPHVLARIVHRPVGVA